MLGGGWEHRHGSQGQPRSGLLGEPRSLLLVKVSGRANRYLFRIVDGVFDKSNELVVILCEHVGWDRVNCQLYSDWCFCKCKPAVIPTGKNWWRRLVRGSK